MFKFLLIFSLIMYSVYKIGSMFFRAGAASQQFRNPPPRQNVDPSPKKDKGKGTISGGEYVDYEEVK
jgi:hypothetical protein